MRENPPRSVKITPPTEADPPVVEVVAPTPPTPVQEGPIVMVNPVLSRQAGLRMPKNAPEIKIQRRKSVSEGGDMYIPKSFERIGNEPIAPQAPEGTPTAPETVLESRKQLATAVNALEEANHIARETAAEIEWLKVRIPETERMLEEEHKSGKFKLSDAFLARQPVSGAKVFNYDKESLDKRLSRHQARLRTLLEAEAAKSAASKPVLVSSRESVRVPQPARSPEVIKISETVITNTGERPAVFANAMNVIDLAKVRQERNEKRLSPKAHSIFGKAAEAWAGGAKGKKKGGGLRAAFLGFMAAIIGLGTVNTGGPARAEGAAARASVERVIQPQRHEAVKVTIHKAGEGEYQLMQDLRASVQKQYPDASTQPEIVKRILHPRTPRELSRALNFVSTDGLSSMVMHPGDSLELTQGKLVFHSQGKADHVLLSEAVPGKVHVEPMKEKLIPSHHHAKHHHTIHHAAHPDANKFGSSMHQTTTHVESTYTPAPSPTPTPSTPEAAPPTTPPADYVVPRPPYYVPPSPAPTAPAEATPAPQPAVPETAPAPSAAPVAPVPAEATPTPPAAAASRVERSKDIDDIVVPQASIDAWNAAKAGPAGQEFPYLNTTNPEHPYWSVWVSDGNGEAHALMMVDEANGKKLPDPTAGSNAGR